MRDICNSMDCGSDFGLNRTMGPLYVRRWGTCTSMKPPHGRYRPGSLAPTSNRVSKSDHFSEPNPSNRMFAMNKGISIGSTFAIRKGLSIGSRISNSGIAPALRILDRPEGLTRAEDGESELPPRIECPHAFQGSSAIWYSHNAIIQSL